MQKHLGPAELPIDESTYSGRFAARLRMLRKDAGLTGAEMASRIAERGFPCKQRAYYAWESGESEPPLDAIPAIASILGIKPRSVFPVE